MGKLTKPRTPSLNISIPPIRSHLRSSSRHSARSGRSRASSVDSNYSVRMDCSPSARVQRWNGVTREATDWNALRRDPEIFFPTGNCLIYLYTQGASRRGPSFRMPYDFLLYSSCRPLIEQALLTSLQAPSYHPGSSTPPSYESLGDASATDHTYLCLYLDAPAGIDGKEVFKYHVTTRNFFAWLVGAPLVGVDPVSALLELKVRMDAWRDVGADNFGALYQYVQEQGYGDFEDIEIQMGRRLEGTDPAPEPVLGPYRNMSVAEATQKMRQPAAPEPQPSEERKEKRGRSSSISRSIRSASASLRRRFSRSRSAAPVAKDEPVPPLPVAIAASASTAASRRPSKTSIPMPASTAPSRRPSKTSVPMPASHAAAPAAAMVASPVAMTPAPGEATRPPFAAPPPPSSNLASESASIMSHTASTTAADSADNDMPKKLTKRQSMKAILKRRLSWAAGPLRPSDDDDMPMGPPGGPPGGGPPGAGPPGGRGPGPGPGPRPGPMGAYQHSPAGPGPAHRPGSGVRGPPGLTIQTGVGSSQSLPVGPKSAPLLGPAANSTVYPYSRSASSMYGSALASQTSLNHVPRVGTGSMYGSGSALGSQTSLHSGYVDADGKERCSCCGKIRVRGVHGSTAGSVVGTPVSAVAGASFSRAAGNVGGSSRAATFDAARRPSVPGSAPGEAVVQLRGNEEAARWKRETEKEREPLETSSLDIPDRNPDRIAHGASAVAPMAAAPVGTLPGQKKRRSWRKSVEIKVPGYGNGVHGFDFGLGRKSDERKQSVEKEKGKGKERERGRPTADSRAVALSPLVTQSRTQEDALRQQQQPRAVVPSTPTLAVPASATSSGFSGLPELDFSASSVKSPSSRAPSFVSARHSRNGSIDPEARRRSMTNSIAYGVQPVMGEGVHHLVTMSHERERQRSGDAQSERNIEGLMRALEDAGIAGPEEEDEEGEVGYAYGAGGVVVSGRRDDVVSLADSKKQDRRVSFDSMMTGAEMRMNMNGRIVDPAKA